MKVALLGNPSVGKSLIFNQLTGIGVEVSNYPGTTVELKGGCTCYKREIVDIIDLPGIYSLDGASLEEKLVRSFLQRREADAVVIVMDATRLERNLYLCMQVAELGLPMIIVLNMMDELAKQGLEIDTDRLTRELGIPVIPTAATIGQNIQEIIPSVLYSAQIPSLTIPYNRSVEAAIRSLDKTFDTSRSESIWALEGIGKNEALIDAAGPIAKRIEDEHRMTVSQVIAANRHHFAQRISEMVLRKHPGIKRFDLDSILTNTFPGIPLLVILLASLLCVVFVVGGFLEQQIVLLFEQYAIEPLHAMNLPQFYDTIALSAILALQAGFGIAFPFVFVFYILISIIEDTGYMTRAAFLADKAMHRIGMHGGAIIPLVLGLGCNVPAMMSLRMLPSRRERMIGAFLITMVPCSARTVIILGIVAAFVGILEAFSIYLLILIILIGTGLFLSRYVPGHQFGLIMEMAPLRFPVPRLVLVKSWLRLKEFFFIAMPLLLVGSVILGIFEYTGILAAFQTLISPFFEGVLGVPSYAATALLFGILRKEMAFETLAVLAGTANLSSVMTALQLYIFAVVSVLFIPCISTVAVLLKEMGTRVTIAVILYTVSLGLGIGAIINFIV